MSATELTRNPVDGSWGLICTVHGVHRAGMSERHAINAEAKHLRDHHGDQLDVTLDLSAAARIVVDQQGSANGLAHLDLWQALTGLSDTREANALARSIAASTEPVTATVTPF